MSQLAITRQRAATWLREHGERLYPALGGMSRKDAARWASAKDMAGLGETVVAWLHGEVAQTPGHCGPPCAETIPLISVLTLVNRAGVVTENSQRAGGRGDRIWNAWVEGFAPDDVMHRLRAMTDGTALRMVACRGSAHGYEGSLLRHLGECPAAAVMDFWTEACPAVAEQLAGSWNVLIEDPEPGRNDRLWPLLAEFAGGAR
jgi:hypothetical protein